MAEENDNLSMSEPQIRPVLELRTCRLCGDTWTFQTSDPVRFVNQPLNPDFQYRTDCGDTAEDGCDIYPDKNGLAKSKAELGQECIMSGEARRKLETHIIHMKPILNAIEERNLLFREVTDDVCHLCMDLDGMPVSPAVRANVGDQLEMFKYTYPLYLGSEGSCDAIQKEVHEHLRELQSRLVKLDETRPMVWALVERVDSCECAFTETYDDLLIRRIEACKLWLHHAVRISESEIRSGYTTFQLPENHPFQISCSPADPYVSRDVLRNDRGHFVFLDAEVAKLLWTIRRYILNKFPV